MRTARDLAAHVLARVHKDKAFAAAALSAELSRAIQLDTRDRALATELVYGTLRVRPWLEEEISRFAPRGTKKLDEHVRAHMLLCAYQIIFTRIPAFAAVNEAVDSVRAARGDRLAAFSNAVLRKVAARSLELGEADRAKALIVSTPTWLQKALGRALGEEGARAFLAAGAAVPPPVFRVQSSGERQSWVERLRATFPHAQFDPGRWSRLAILARCAGSPGALPGIAEGNLVSQEEGSQLAALALGVRKGDVVLDACAGRGQKTAILARAAGHEGGVDACDALPAKLERLRIELGRAHLSPRATYAVDWTVGSGEVQGLYDRALVDAPCSGAGTLRRRPEIALRRGEGELAALAGTQLAIAKRVVDRVRPGGVLVYVVCSVLREEAEDVVDRLLGARPDLAPAPFVLSELEDAPDLAQIAKGHPSLRILPHVHGTDGFFMARFRRIRAA